MAILRTYEPEYGGLQAWGKGHDIPVYFADGVFDQAVFDAVLADRNANARIERKLDLIGKAEPAIARKVGELVEEAREYVRAHPNVAAKQLKDAFVEKIKKWASQWTGGS